MTMLFGQPPPDVNIRAIWTFLRHSHILAKPPLITRQGATMDSGRPKDHLGKDVFHIWEGKLGQ